MAFILEFAEANEETLLDSMLLNLLTTTASPYWEDVDCAGIMGSCRSLAVLKLVFRATQLGLNVPWLEDLCGTFKNTTLLASTSNNTYT